MQQLCNNVMGHLVSLNYYPVFKVKILFFISHSVFYVSNFFFPQLLLLKGLCGQRRYLKHAAVSAIITLSMRPLIAADFSNRLLTIYILNILSVPGIFLHLQLLSPEVYKIYTLLRRFLYVT